MSEPTLTYDAAKRQGVIKFPNGHELRVSNVDETKAKEFFTKHAGEFHKRDCVLHSVAGFETREAAP